MAAVIDIVNRALTKLGERHITSLGDDVKAARAASSLYDIVRDAEIAAHSWNFAKKRDKLSAEAAKPEFGWSFQYLLPADCLRLLQLGSWPQPVMSDYVNGENRQYVLEGGRILTNLGPTLNIIYLWRETEAGVYPPVFVEALACKLAVEMAEILSGSGSKRQMAWEEYEQAVKMARKINAISQPPQMVQDDTWMLAHRMGVI